MSQKQYWAKITLLGEVRAIEVVVPANDSSQAKKIIERMYGKVSWWNRSPELVR